MELNRLLHLLYQYLCMYWSEQVDTSLKPKDSADNKQCRNITYDFIIVGAGTSGCVVANRLTEYPEWKVLLIEAGGDEDWFTDTPALDNQLHGRKYDWNFTTTEQKHVCADQQGRCRLPKGHVMGGTSSISNLLYFRGHPTAYDEWEAMGNPGWNFENALYYYKKIENMTIPKFAQDTEYHSTKGPMPIAYPPTNSTVAADYFKASVDEYGVPAIDYNADKYIGANYVQSSLKGATRCSSSKAYLDPIRERDNLVIFKNTMAIKVLFNEKQAIGVTCVTNGEQYNVYSSKEVIISAGTINTAKLLMLSGIGPREHLESLGIPVLADLPVGQYFQDEPAVYFNYYAEGGEFDYTTESLENEILEYAKNKRGLLSQPLWKCVGLVNSSDPKATDTIPTNLFTNNVALPPLSSFTDKPALSTLINVLSPASVGTVTLKSANYQDPPLINPNYFNDDNDLELIIQSANINYEYSQTKTLERYKPQLIVAPQCDFPGNFTEEFTRCHIKYNTVAGQNTYATARMGPETDEKAVVDSTLKVHKLHCIRIVDSSIVPKSTMGHPFAGEVMIGEKGSDIIKDHHNKQ